MITLLWPCTKFVITDDWSEHIARPRYNRAYAGTDLAGPPQPLRPSQYNGRVLQSMWSTQGYGYTTFVEYSDDTGPLVRIRNAHQSNLGVKVGDVVSPQHNLGTLGTTGNSTGNHTHFEVWLKLNTGWQNIDPLDPKYGIKLVYDPAQLIPLAEGVEMPIPEYKIPEVCDLPEVKTSSYVQSYVNLREQPFISAKKIGEVRPGETWEMFASHIDVLGNVWFGVRRNLKVGWAASKYGKDVLLIGI